MKKMSLVLGFLLFTSAALYATPCEEVMQMIAEKIKNNGVKEFTLESIDKGTPTDRKIVGVCGEGTKDIIYYKGKPSNTTSESIMFVISPEKAQENPEVKQDISETKTAE
ncbi:MAG: DUF1161 domain-containing protein [Campylobacteraceae bacterium]|jgi:hypothetical protein|nr:DUF1161 domain-containing protein [Campylobacteraceae bacterium]